MKIFVGLVALTWLLIGLIAIYSKSSASSFDLVELRLALASDPLAASTQKHVFGLLLVGFGILVVGYLFNIVL